ncbi:hypothetical protein BHM03_00057616 [Ensete ventricosum]|nr:hypothetical protein BHM03_00057616 [Ensete ventricosum]
MCVRGRITCLTMIGAIELQQDYRPRSSLGIKLGSDDEVGPHREFARRFAKGNGKLVGNTLGDRQKKTIRLTARMSEAVGLSGTMVRPPVPWNQGDC